MRGGRIEQVGAPRALYDRPASRYVADFIGETNLLPVGAGEWLSVRPEVMSLGDAGVAGRVADVSYAGAVVKIRVVLDDRTVVVVQQPAHLAVPAVGGAVRVSWPADREVRVRE
jgi:ABC-type Fe3+/spermidine/putrescine transport system ATPase subunit